MIVGRVAGRQDMLDRTLGFCVTQPTTAQVIEVIQARGFIADIGQFPRGVTRDLKALVRRGVLRTFKAHWDTGSSAGGCGGLKICYGAGDAWGAPID